MAAINDVLLNRRILVVLAILAVSGMAYYYLAIFLPNSQPTSVHPTIGRSLFGNDFYQVWLTSRECVLQRIDPYSLAITHRIQIGVFGHELNSSDPYHLPNDYRAFPYPAFVDVFGLPVAWLPFSKAKIVLVVILIFLATLSVLLWSKPFWWSRSFPVLLVFIGLTLSSYQGLESLYDLQPGLIVGFLLALTITALAANKLWLAGCALAFSTIKPQVSSLLIFYLLLWGVARWWERRKFVLAFMVTLTTLCGAAMLVWPTWIVRWLQAMIRYPGYYSWPPLLDIFGPYFGGALLMLALAAAILFAWSNRHEEALSFHFGLTVSLLLAITTVTILPEHAVYDQLILLPGIMTVVSSWRMIWGHNVISKSIFVLAAGALFWQWIAASIVVFVRAIAPHLISTVLFLPLRTALAIPFATIALLFLTIRQSAKKQFVLATTRL